MTELLTPGAVREARALEDVEVSPRAVAAVERWEAASPGDKVRWPQGQPVMHVVEVKGAS